VNAGNTDGFYQIGTAPHDGTQILVRTVCGRLEIAYFDVEDRAWYSIGSDGRPFPVEPEMWRPASRVTRFLGTVLAIMLVFLGILWAWWGRS
jgi:hypothetical protein